MSLVRVYKAVFNHVFCKIMRNILSFEYDAIGIVYNGKFSLYDNYTNERIITVSEISHLTDTSIVSTIITLCFKIDDSDLLLSEFVSRKSDPILSLVDALLKQKCNEGDVLIESLQSRSSILIPTSTFTISNDNNVCSSIGLHFDNNLDLLFSMMPSLLRTNNERIVNIFSSINRERDERDNTLLIKNSVIEINRRIQSIFNSIESSPCSIPTLDIEFITSSLDKINEVCNIDKIQHSINPEKEYMCRIYPGQVTIDDSVLLIDTNAPELSILDTERIKSIVEYLNEVNSYHPLIPILMDELESRK